MQRLKGNLIYYSDIKGNGSTDKDKDMEHFIIQMGQSMKGNG